MKTLETACTTLREIVESDAEFILDLLNQPSFIKYIGDRDVRTVEQSREFIETRFRASYRQFGYGLWAIELKETGEAIGICGFVKRDFLPAADLGFALLPQFERKGYVFEAASASLKYGRDKLNLTTILAITSKHNEASCRLLEKLGFKYERFIKPAPDAEELKLFSSNTENRVSRITSRHFSPE